VAGVVVVAVNVEEEGISPFAPEAAQGALEAENDSP